VMLDVVAAGKVAVRTFFFPGWIAKLDGKQVEILTGADGEIVIDVPAGSHRLTLEFGPTRVRSLGSFLSISTLVMLLGATFYAGYLRTRRKHPSETIKD
jgi:uncharacterized membrane protein YfhO